MASSRAPTESHSPPGRIPPTRVLTEFFFVQGEQGSDPSDWGGSRTPGNQIKSHLVLLALNTTYDIQGLCNHPPFDKCSTSTPRAKLPVLNFFGLCQSPKIVFLQHFFPQTTNTFAKLFCSFRWTMIFVLQVLGKPTVGVGKDGAGIRQLIRGQSANSQTAPPPHVIATLFLVCAD